LAMRRASQGIGRDGAHIAIAPEGCSLRYDQSLSVLLSLDDKLNKDVMKNYLLAFYAAQYCLDHTRLYDVSSDRTSFRPTVHTLHHGCGYTTLTNHSGNRCLMRVHPYQELVHYITPRFVVFVTSSNTSSSPVHRTSPLYSIACHSYQEQL
jgi:hypothetical protein